jgi:pyruvate/2-oxoglutarate dehydrogenase complex dihydrolipoamide acyltransferase (E2) component
VLEWAAADRIVHVCVCLCVCVGQVQDKISAQVNTLAEKMRLEPKIFTEGNIEELHKTKEALFVCGKRPPPRPPARNATPARLPAVRAVPACAQLVRSAIVWAAGGLMRGRHGRIYRADGQVLLRQAAHAGDGRRGAAGGCAPRQPSAICD